jgi:hypothetical protein
MPAATAASIAAKHAPKRRATAVTRRGPDLEGIEAFIKDATETKVSAVKRDSLVRQTFTAELRILENEKASLGEKRSLADRLHDALIIAIDAEEADIDAAIARYRNGLLDGAEHQPERIETT